MDLGTALRTVAARAGWQVYANAEDVNGVRAPALNGTMSPREAIERLVSGTGLVARFKDGRIVIRRRGARAGETGTEEIVVTGTHIRGVVPTGPVIRVSREAITRAGQVDLGEAARTIPQNFSGGQNPGIGTGAGLANANVNSSSTINLRGLGQDATLTLLNGHRLPYDSVFNGVDVSAIPVAALDRIEIVADGASAQYGSDAVAGVANVILRRDFDGLVTSARLGGATDGGYMQQHADAVGGTTWSGGGVLLAYDYARNSRVAARQRSYTDALAPNFSLYPEIKRHALTLAGHQELMPGMTFSLDALYSKRRSTTIGGTAQERYEFKPKVQTWSIAPELEVALGGDWTVKALGAFGRDSTHVDTRYTPTNGAMSRTSGCFCNEAISAEVNAEGPLLRLPGGEARVAIGAGYRRNSLDYSQLISGGAATRFDVSRDSTYAFGELYLPVIAPQQGITGIDRLTLSAALRYENYPDLAHLATPRLGLAWSPVPDFTLKGSWSRSFKAPTLYQQYISYQAILLPAAPYGAGTATQSIVFAAGGNPDLEPERARSWTAGLEWQSGTSPGLKIGASYFDIAYRDRVAQPIAGAISRAFSEPGYASLVDRSPDATMLAELIAGADLGLRNFSGLPYDPSRVAAFLDNRNINVAAQSINGFDAHAQWRLDLSNGEGLTFDIAGTHLLTRQRITNELPATRLSGTIFNPSRLRARGSIQYERARAHAALFANYIGKLTDERFATRAVLKASVNFDLTASYDLIEGRGVDPGLSVSLTINNLFNDRPPIIAQTGPTDTPYDSTNYSPVGRFVAVGVRRAW